MMEKPGRLQKKGSWPQGSCCSHTGSSATITEYSRNTRSASPANRKYVMGWSSFLSQMITCPRASASGKDLPEKSFKSAPIDSPASASDRLKASLQTEAGLRWMQSRRLTWTGRARWEQVLQVSLNIIFRCVKTSIINITVSRNRKLAGHCGQRGFARIEIIPCEMISTIFPSLFTFPSPSSNYEEKMLVQVLPLLLNNFSSYKLLWTFRNSKPPLGRSHKDN